MVSVSSISATTFLDTAPLIYFIEGNSAYQAVLAHLFEANEKGQFKFITSAITLPEVLVKPLRANEPKLAEAYQGLLTTAVTI